MAFGEMKKQVTKEHMLYDFTSMRHVELPSSETKSRMVIARARRGKEGEGGEWRPGIWVKQKEGWWVWERVGEPQHRWSSYMVMSSLCKSIIGLMVPSDSGSGPLYLFVLGGILFLG